MIEPMYHRLTCSVCGNHLCVTLSETHGTCSNCQTVYRIKHVPKLVVDAELTNIKRDAAGDQT